jgi:hypothetical protein
VKFSITHLKGSRAGKTEQLDADVITVGRDPQNTLAFDPMVDDKVSSFHASLMAQGAQVIVTDVGSRNGTYVNGHRISGPTPIVSGGVVQFGEGGPTCAIMFAAGAAAAPPAAAAAVAPIGTPVTAPPPAAAAKPAPPAAKPPVAPTEKVPAAATPAPAAAKPTAAAPKRGCLVPAACLSMLLACVIGIAAVSLREQISAKLPPDIVNLLKKIPVVGKLFKIPAPPKLPGGTAGKLLKTATEAATKEDPVTEAPPPTTETGTEQR